MARLLLPENLHGIFFDQIWDKTKVWALPTALSMLPIEELVWHLDLTVWTTVPGEPRFDLAPRTVLDRPAAFPRDWQKIVTAETTYPLEMFQRGERWVILDGYHRLARHVLEGTSHIPVRLHPDEFFEDILANVGASAG